MNPSYIAGSRPSPDGCPNNYQNHTAVPRDRWHFFSFWWCHP